MDVPSDHIPYLKKSFDRLETGLAGFLQASAPDWFIYDFASHWLPPIATKLGMDDDDKDRVDPAITESSWAFGADSDSVYFFGNDRDNSILSEFGWNLRPELAVRRSFAFV
ncbi:putative UDP-rhamnose:rhamnosyltransferase 1 [Camellia lanceoleosa]|uniref:UDP-rhamnose:rhamnosyltransferase 1 n=1 Tax=Camellia lanceoleosa TaxID=1840588 RepID=A0ACC0GHL5_9ERIC|nr:putative UDP-rhamnose:rhamnosyltransferase 1 [Camellia lanceoleosa]